MAINIIWHFTTYIIDFNNYQKNVANIELDEIDLENVEDGIYSGATNFCNVIKKAIENAITN